jgi:hypothetical protein
MKSLIVKVAFGLVLFAGSLVGALAGTGRLNHEGTANIPVLGSFFPAPPPADDPSDKAGADAEPKTQGATAEATHDGGARIAADASHAQEPHAQEPANAPTGPVKSKVGKSVVNPDKPPADAHGGGEGHDADPHAEDHGKDEGNKDAHQDEPAAKPEDTAPAPPAAAKGTEHAAHADLHRLEQELAGDRKNRYAPGGYFRFDGMPAGLTAEQINDAWQRVQGVLTDAERRKTALDLREQELQELADDISRRQHELGRERTKIEERHRELDARIQKFQEQVKLVRSDEVAALKRNAETLGSFEPEKAAQLVLDQWKTDRGQDEVLRTLEFMDKDAVNAIVNELPNPTVQDLLKKRLRVSKESVPTAPSK